MTVYLLDSPLMLVPKSRTILIQKMADEIVIDGVIGDRADAVRILRNRGYSVTEVHCLVDEARTVAFQDFVAEQMQDLVTREMAKP